MAAGLQCFDANGNLMLDLNDRIARYIGEAESTITDGYITDNSLTEFDNISLWVIPYEVTVHFRKYSTYPNDNVCAPWFSISGNKLQWTLPNKSARILLSFKFYYGVY